MENTINTRVSKTKTATGKNFTGDKLIGINAYIFFYEVDDDDDYDRVQ